MQLIPIRWLPCEAVIEDDYSTKTDVFSFAVLVWEVTQQAAIPFSNMTNEAVLESLQSKELLWKPSEMEKAVPKCLLPLLLLCLDPCPRNRPTFSSIVTKLNEISGEEFDV